MPYTINNPGGGDCGFYAFAIGLIDIIQHEYTYQATSATFDCWQRQGLDLVTLQQILDIDLNNLYKSTNYKKELLFTLQMSLRASIVNAIKTDLDSKIKLNDGLTNAEESIAYGSFMELVIFYLKRNDTLRQIIQYNELASSPKVLKLAQQTAKSLKNKLNKDLSFEETQKIENAHVKQVLLDDVSKNNSVILKGIDKIKEKGRWATHSDLKEIAVLFNVNLQVVGKLNGVPIPSIPTVTLNNVNNAHWTTIVNELPQQRSLRNKRSIEDISPFMKESQISNKKQYKSSLSQPTDRLFSINEEYVIAATVSTQVQQDKADRYREHLKDLIHASSTLGLFAQMKNKIDVNTIDTAQAIVNISGEKESDESFAVRLQEAELRLVHLT